MARWKMSPFEFNRRRNHFLHNKYRSWAIDNLRTYGSSRPRSNSNTQTPSSLLSSGSSSDSIVGDALGAALCLGLAYWLTSGDDKD